MQPIALVSLNVAASTEPIKTELFCGLVELTGN